MLARDHLYPRPQDLVTFLGLHDVARFMNEPGATHEGLALAFTFLMTARGTPLVYYGDEIGMPGGNDPDNRRDFPGGFPGDARDAFRAAGRTPPEERLFQHVRRLAHLRRELEPLRRGEMIHLHAADQTYAFARRTASGMAVIAFNNAASAAEVAFAATPAGVPEGQMLDDRLGTLAPVAVRDGRIGITLPPRSAAILVPR
jgi:glycosidase